MKQGTFEHEIYIEAEPKEIGIISTIRKIAFWMLKRYTNLGEEPRFAAFFAYVTVCVLGLPLFIEKSVCVDAHTKKTEENVWIQSLCQGGNSV